MTKRVMIVDALNKLLDICEVKCCICDTPYSKEIHEWLDNPGVCCYYTFRSGGSDGVKMKVDC